jgi:hypothetical protein
MPELLTAAALLLNRWTGHRSVGTKHAAVARLGLKQYFATRALIIKLARVRRHHLFALLPAAGAGEHGLQNDRAHGFTISFDGNPASFVA